MIEVWMATCATEDDPVRFHLMQAAAARWRLDPLCDLKIIRPEDTGADRRAFMGQRRRWIEERAGGDFYIQCDDDCVGLRPDFIARGLALMRENPEFAVISARFLHEPLWRYTGPIGEDLALTSGGINFIRKGPLAAVLPHEFGDGIYDDSSMTRDLRKGGFRVGMARDWWQNHLGAGLSVTWPDYYATNRTQVGPVKITSFAVSAETWEAVKARPI